MTCSHANTNTKWHNQRGWKMIQMGNEEARKKTRYHVAWCSNFINVLYICYTIRTHSRVQLFQNISKIFLSIGSFLFFFSFFFISHFIHIPSPIFLSRVPNIKWINARKLMIFFCCCHTLTLRCCCLFYCRCYYLTHSFLCCVICPFGLECFCPSSTLFLFFFCISINQHTIHSFLCVSLQKKNINSMK